MDRALPSPTADELLAQLGWVRSLASSLVADPARADDVAQDATLLALERLPAGARSGSALRAWLAGVTRKLAHGSRRAEARRASREAQAARPEAEGSADEIVERADLHQRLVQAVLALDEPYRSAVLLRHLEGLGAPAIAERTGVTPAAVRQRISRGLAQLREQLDGDLGGRHAWFPTLTGLAAATAPSPAGSVAVLGATWLSAKLAAALLVLGAGLVALVSRNGAGPDGPGPTIVTTAREAPDGPNAAELTTPVQFAGGDEPRVAAAPEVSSVPGKIVITGTLRHLDYPGVATPPNGGVEITAELHHKFPPSRTNVVTDDDGRFRVELEDPGERPLRANLFVAADETHRWLTKRHRFQDGETEWDVQLERAAHGRLEGRVVDLAGNPVEGLTLRISQAATSVEQMEEEPLQVRTGPDGTFSIEPYRGLGGFMGNEPLAEVQDDGWRIVSSATPKRTAGGGWDPVELVACGTGSLRLQCVDADGSPVEAMVQLAIAGSEREGQTSSLGRLLLTGETDDTGLIHFDDAWAGRRLALNVFAGDASFLVERFSGDRGLLATGSEGQGMPIVVPAAGELALTLVLAPWLTIRGRVLKSNGEPLAEAWVDVDELLVPDWRRGRNEGQCRTDARGAFEWTTRLPVTGRRVRLVAGDTEPGGPGNWSSPWGEPSLVAESILENDFDPQGGNVREVELTVIPTLTIEGKVVDASGAPVQTVVRAVPEGVSLVAVGETVRSQATRSGEDGTFTVPALVPGRYDLVVDVPGHGFFTSSFVRERFAGVEAGTTGLELVLDEAAVVRVSVRALAPGDTELSKTGVTIAKIHPRADVDLGARIPATQEHFHDRSGWVPAATLSLGGGQAFSKTEVAFFEGLYTGADGDQLELPPLEEGLYWLGVRGWDADGRALHPTGTGYLNLVEGSYRFDFVVDETGDLPGNARGPLGAKELYVCLVDDSGEPIHLRVGDRAQPFVPIGSDGDFELEAVPVGDFEAWFGTRADLEAKDPLLETRVVVHPGENPPLVVDLE